MPSNTSSPHHMDGAAPPSYDDLEKLIRLVCDGDLHGTRAALSSFPDREFAAVTEAVIETRQHHHDIYDQVLRLIALEAVTRATGQES
ncbi:hypothetical protein [Rhodococcus sp. MEB032]|uniref:hypothetical protein n=1 Tax=Rhodococcus sp. MEB032 TaxID=3040322 RepID=UPI00254C6A35|nr:hypothetical protein [Rhodococcus sp. MEB032]